MKPLYFLLLLLVWTSCSETKVEQNDVKTKTEEIVNPAPKKVVNENFQKHLDKAHLNGVIVIFDPQTKTYYSNDFKRSEKGYLPASTFKIPNSIIALETGVVEDENTFFKWDGKKRYFKMWEKDMIFKDAYKKSCLPCYQEIARDIGIQRMKDNVKKLEYGNMIFEESSVDDFWITGDSKITAMQQIDFLSRLYYEKLPISKRTYQILKPIMQIDEKPNYTLSGKTGWSKEEDFNLGWFVGYLKKGDDVYFMATNVDPKEDFDMKNFIKIRLEMTKEALKELEII